MDIQSSLNTELFEITPINPDLVNSIDQVYTLRQIAIQFFCNQRHQTLMCEDDVERARAIVALSDVLWRSNIQPKVLIITELSKTLAQIERSFQLHAKYLQLNSLSNIENLEKNIHLCTYQKIIKNLTPDATEKYLNQFDLIIVEDLEHEKNSLFKRRLKYNKSWLLNIYLPISTNLLL